MLAGSSSFVGLLYAQSLWTLTERAPAAQQVRLRETAAMAFAYTYGAITIDGARCGDPSAPAHRLEQLAALLPGFADFLAAQPADRRALMAEGARLIDAKTAAVRDAAGDVAFLCVGGMEEMTYNLTHGGTREVPTPPGRVGRTVEAYGGGKYRPSLRPAAEWRPAAIAARARLPALLSALLGLTPAVRVPPQP